MTTGKVNLTARKVLLLRLLPPFCVARSSAWCFGSPKPPMWQLSRCSSPTLRGLYSSPRRKPFAASGFRYLFVCAMRLTLVSRQVFRISYATVDVNRTSCPIDGHATSRYVPCWTVVSIPRQTDGPIRSKRVIHLLRSLFEGVLERPCTPLLSFFDRFRGTLLSRPSKHTSKWLVFDQCIHSSIHGVIVCRSPHKVKNICELDPAIP